MVNRGTPLRKFGGYRVRRVSNRCNPLYVLVNERNEFDVVLMSYCVGALNWFADRLGAGRMAATPKEVEAASVDVFPSLNATRFEYCRERWTHASYVRWINGGPIGENFDWIAPEGSAYYKTKYAKDADTRKTWSDDARAHEDECDEFDRRVRDQYAAGEWPDASDDGTDLFGDTDRSMMASLLAAEASPVWVDAGRDAMRILLKFGVDDSEMESLMSFRSPSRKHASCGTRERLVVLAEKLAAKYGGEWGDKSGR